MADRAHCLCRRPARHNGHHFNSGHPSEPTIAQLAFRYLSQLASIRICRHIEGGMLLIMNEGSSPPNTIVVIGLRVLT
jgi:hypothetical protein